MTTHDTDHSLNDDSPASQSVPPTGTPEENRRTRFRLRLPENATLVATINEIKYDVIEIAEHSLVVTAEGVFSKSGECDGVIEWSDGRTSSFTGQIGRVTELGRVIWNIEGISTPHVVKEQRRLLKSFPTLRDEEFKIGIFAPDG